MTNPGKTPEREARTMRQTYAYEAFRENYHDSYVDPKDAFDAGYRAGAEARAMAKHEQLQGAYNLGYQEGAEAQRERDAQLVEPDDFEAGSSEWCALQSVQNAIRSAPIEGEPNV